jgi:hypothetical protein
MDCTKDLDCNNGICSFLFFGDDTIKKISCICKKGWINYGNIPCSKEVDQEHSKLSYFLIILESK